MESEQPILKFDIKAEDGIDYSRQWVRSFLFVALAFVIVFILIDRMQIPQEAFPIYLKSRLLFQVLPIVIGIALTFIPDYTKIYQPTLFIIATIVSLSNIDVIWRLWQHSKFAFDFEGLMLYLGFYFFIARMSFKYAVIHAVIVSIVFSILVFNVPVYGLKSEVYLGFVISTYIIGLIGVFKLQKVLEEKYEYSQTLLKLSITDRLTGVLNRKGYEEYANMQLSLCKRNIQNLSLIIFDIDHFKQYNDDFGHIKGDEILKLKAAVLEEIFKRDSDVIARYGGDEYVVIVSNLTAIDVKSLAQKVIDKWKSLNLNAGSEDDELIINCSVGAYTKIPDTNDDLEAYFKHADKALYQAKEKGRARVVSIDGNRNYFERESALQTD
ncbi:MAG: GGDEF domain-containing protein [Gammaproteobacteria bacterium]|nr:GGDEF domain-containing protein [Gammaproteobacteria bacterium]